MSVLVNGSASKEFKLQKGLHQWDPISPFLFNVVVEGLNVLFERAREQNLIKGTRIGLNGVLITHLQFADDTIILCNKDRVEMENIKRILGCFQLMLGLQINFGKSSLCGVKIPIAEVNDLANIMGCKVECLPMKYLGLPLGANPTSLKTWKPVIESMEKRLNIWRGRQNSTGGKLTLMNSALVTLPVYFLSLFKMPTSVAKIIEKLQRNFFWGETREKKKLHLVKCETIMRKKENGGLGVKNLRIQNLSLLAKWWWRFNKEPEAL